MDKFHSNFRQGDAMNMIYFSLLKNADRSTRRTVHELSRKRNPRFEIRSIIEKPTWVKRTDGSFVKYTGP